MDDSHASALRPAYRERRA
jgi:cold shock protein